MSPTASRRVMPSATPSAAPAEDSREPVRDGLKEDFDRGTFYLNLC
jgi:hypothetical protein